MLDAPVCPPLALTSIPLAHYLVQDRAAWLKYGPLQSCFAQKRLLRCGPVLKHLAPVRHHDPDRSCELLRACTGSSLALRLRHYHLYIAQIDHNFLYYTSGPIYTKRSGDQSICDIFLVAAALDFWHPSSSRRHYLPVHLSKLFNHS